MTEWPEVRRWLVQHPGLIIALLPIVYGLAKLVRVSHFSRTSLMAMLRYSSPIDILVGTIAPLTATLVIVAAGYVIAALVRSPLSWEVRAAGVVISVGLGGFVAVSMPADRLLLTLLLIVAMGGLAVLVVPKASKLAQAAVVGLLVAALQVMFVDEMWLPPEVIVHDGGVVTVGYVLSDDGTGLVVIREDDRTVVRIERSSVSDQQFCQLSPTSRSVLERIRGAEADTAIDVCPSPEPTEDATASPMAGAPPPVRAGPARTPPR